MNTEELLKGLQLMAAKPVLVKGVTVEGQPVYIRPLTVAEVDGQAEDTPDTEDVTEKTRLAKGAAKLICTEEGERLLDPANPAHLAVLNKLPWSTLRTIINADAPEDDALGNVQRDAK